MISVCSKLKSSRPSTRLGSTQACAPIHRLKRKWPRSLRCQTFEAASESGSSLGPLGESLRA